MVLEFPLFRAEHRRYGPKKARGLSESAAGGRVSACSGRIGDAQDNAEHGRFVLVTFIDEVVKSRCGNPFVIPAQAGIHLFQWVMDSRLRGSDGLRTFYGSIFYFTRNKSNTLSK
ncbi:MAG: hypothetical protein HF981_18645 [Desulfobacteraceae bacterium]|nr:hypothetical protein [Desulfobacteraceae bacterium]MBC2752417.1 hypothetical protein [Desulfobacteraceae bacterium]